MRLAHITTYEDLRQVDIDRRRFGKREAIVTDLDWDSEVESRLDQLEQIRELPERDDR